MSLFDRIRHRMTLDELYTERDNLERIKAVYTDGLAMLTALLEPFPMKLGDQVLEGPLLKEETVKRDECANISGMITRINVRIQAANQKIADFAMITAHLNAHNDARAAHEAAAKRLRM